VALTTPTSYMWDPSLRYAITNCCVFFSKNQKMFHFAFTAQHEKNYIKCLLYNIPTCRGLVRIVMLSYTSTCSQREILYPRSPNLKSLRSFPQYRIEEWHVSLNNFFARRPAVLSVSVNLSILPGKCRDDSSCWATKLPSTSLPIYYSLIILSLNAT
jgi:hypothetical protein